MSKKLPKYSRDEIERIVEQTGSLFGLDLSHTDLSDMHLMGVDMGETNLTRSNLERAHLFGANLRGAKLFKANLERANLNGTDLRDCDFLGAILENTRLNNIKLDEGCIVVNERDALEALASGDKLKAKAKFEEARDIYALLRTTLSNLPKSTHLGTLFVREMVVTRKLMPRWSVHRLWSAIVGATTGYGEHIDRIIISIFTTVAASALIYGIEGVQYGERLLKFGEPGYTFLGTLGELLYFSMVVFTTVGFGEIVPIGPLSKITMMIEGFSSTVLLAILIIAMYKRSMAR